MNALPPTMMTFDLLFTFFSFGNLAKRPPVEETANFLQSLLANHGPNYLEKLFGKKARDALAPLGGSHQVAVALSGKCVDSRFANPSPIISSSHKQKAKLWTILPALCI